MKNEHNCSGYLDLLSRGILYSEIALLVIGGGSFLVTKAVGKVYEALQDGVSGLEGPAIGLFFLALATATVGAVYPTIRRRLED